VLLSPGRRPSPDEQALSDATIAKIATTAPPDVSTLMTAHPEGRIEVRRIEVRGNEIWVQNRYTSDDLEMEAIVIYEIDPATDTILAGHYYSEKVDHGGPEINAWMEAL
jgi:hypothetical protein